VVTHLDEDAVEAEDAASRLRAVGSRGDRRFLNRELSWLDFNARVLALAEDEDQPLLERAKFLAIFAENLDEFFQVRVAGLKDQLAAGLGAPRGEGDSPVEQLQAIRSQTERLVDRQVQVFLKSMAPSLSERGIVFSEWDALDDDDRSYLVDVFEKSIYPVLTPLAVDPGHPFPYISNLSLNLAVIVRDPQSGERRFARVKVPPLLSRFVVMPDGERFVPLEQVIAAHLHLLFPGMDVESVATFRVTRNADLSVEEDEADDLLVAMEMELRRRRFGRAVRLEVDVDTTPEVCELLLRELELGPDDLYRLEGPLDLGGLWAVYELPRPELKDEPWVPVTQARLSVTDDDGPTIFDVIRDGELLVHHPYDSFATSVEDFIEEAASHPQVLAIKQTLYRTSGDSPIVRALIHAAEQGKQVVALVELKARFDEQANIAWAKALEQAGVHVVYGLVGLKTHTKTALVVREEDDGTVRRYCHVGTGNYNSKTARLYEDIGLLSCDPDLGADLTELFNYLTGYSRKVDYAKLLVAPLKLREEILRLIGEQTSADGRIVMKMNNLVDQEVIDALYAASQAGAEIDLIVRSVCCLRPGVPGLSENITVRSIVGRYLEHSRIYGFGKRRRRKYYIGSADLMPRNLDRRVEALAPVTDEELIDRLQGILDINREDDTLSWELGPDGVWDKVPTVDGVNTHRRLQELALERTRRRRDVPIEA
jgi:polyphosphate kinase